MRRSINRAWQKDMIRLMDKGLSIDVTTSFNPSVQWLIQRLVIEEIPYKLYQLGAGVKRVTTDQVDTCPCCKRKLRGVK